MNPLFHTLVTFALLVAAATPTFPPGGAPDVVATAQAQAPAEFEPVDLNVADAEALQKVPGIGQALARRIVEFREENGPFEKVDDLLNVRGIGVASLEKLRPYVKVQEGG